MIELDRTAAAWAFVGVCACGLPGTLAFAQEPAKQATAAKDARSRAASAAREAWQAEMARPTQSETRKPN